MRILKGYSKEEQKELENAKRKYMNSGGLLQIMTGVPLDVGCGFIWKKYAGAGPDEQVSIIRDILDFYTDKAEFKEQKYYVKLSKRPFPYLVQADYGIDWSMHRKSGYKEEFTEQEIKAIDPRYMAFAVPVEVDDE